MTVGEFIHKYRKKRGEFLTNVAKHCEISRYTLLEVERGQASLKPHQFVNIIRFLDIPEMEVLSVLRAGVTRDAK